METYGPIVGYILAGAFLGFVIKAIYDRRKKGNYVPKTTPGPGPKNKDPEGK